MKDMSSIANKKIINKETNEVRLVVSIDEENRKIHSVPVDEPNAEPSIMAAASYDRRWKLYEEPEAEVSETAEPEVNHDEPMKMSDVVTKLESLFDILNRVYFDNALPKPVITVQSTPKAYGHCSTKKIWKSENDGQYEINIGAEFLNRPSANTAATTALYLKFRSLALCLRRKQRPNAKSLTATCARSAGRKLRRPPTSASFAVSARSLWRGLIKRTPEQPVSRPKFSEGKSKGP